MQKIEFQGETYYYYNNKFVDTTFIEVNKTLQNQLFEQVFLKTDYKNYNKDELLEFIFKAKENEKYSLTKDACLFGIDNFENHSDFIKVVLPVLTSCYRKLNQPEKAIEIAGVYEHYKEYRSSALFTSVGAAYCDMQDLDQATKYADMAYAINEGFGTEISALYERIESLKETL